MRTRPRATSTELRLAIACLPRHTREAMLTGISGNDIIVGAYATGDGICPMLAAHRNGGRANFIGFASAWDRFTSRDGRRHRARRATERELRMLRAHLEASLLEDEHPEADLGAAHREHAELVSQRKRRTARVRAGETRRLEALAAATPVGRRGRPGDRDRRSELDSHPGWSWSRPVRRYDDYERLLKHLENDSTRSDGARAVPASAVGSSPP